MPKRTPVLHLFSPEKEELNKTRTVLERLAAPPVPQETLDLLLQDPDTWPMPQVRQIVYPLSAIYHRFTHRLSYDQQGDIALHYPAIIDTEVDLEEYCTVLADRQKTEEPGDYITRQTMLKILTDVADHIDILEMIVERNIPCPVDQRTDDPLGVDGTSYDDEY